jgi:hypothetical protein
MQLYLTSGPSTGAPLLFSLLLLRDGIFKLLRGPGIDSKKSIPTAYVASQAGTATLFLLVPSFHRLF